MGEASRHDDVAGGLALVEDEVRELVRRREVDPIEEPEVVRSLVEEVLNEYGTRSLTGTLPALGDITGVARQVYDAVAGFGPLQRYLDDPAIEEVWINEPGRVFVARGGRSELTTTILDGSQVADLVERMLKHSGRRVDVSSPFVDAMLPDGSRLHCVIPDVTRRHWAVNIRKPERTSRVLIACLIARNGPERASLGGRDYFSELFWLPGMVRVRCIR